jgi:hypothetical protein
MKRFKRLLVVACAVFVAAGVLLPAQPVDAQSSASLSIVPRKNYTVEPGKSIKDTLTIRNLDDSRSLDLNLRVVDFTFTDDGGAPQLMLAQDAPQTTWSMKPFLSVPQSVSIAPSSSQTLDIGVDIPANQGAGSYYSAIVYSTGSPDGGNVGLSASGVTLVFTSIPGDVDEMLTLKKLGAYSSAKAGQPAGFKWLATNEPESIGYTVQNDGNVAESPVGSITLKHMFGKEYVINDINTNKSLALIGQTRTFTPCIKVQSQDVDFSGTRSAATACTSAGLWPGFYSISMNAFYGQNGNNTQEINGSASFVYLPWWFIIVALIILAILVFLIWRLVRMIRGSGAPRGDRRPRSRRGRNQR